MQSAARIALTLTALAATAGARPQSPAGALGDRTSGVESATIAGLHVSVWRPVPASNHAPAVIFSHGFHGSSLQSTFLMKALARDGYLVIAPNHADAIARGGGTPEALEGRFGRPDTWTDATHRARGDDIRRLVADDHVFNRERCDYSCHQGIASTWRAISRGRSQRHTT